MNAPKCFGALIIIFALLLSGCGGGAPGTEAPTASTASAPSPAPAQPTAAAGQPTPTFEPASDAGKEPTIAAAPVAAPTALAGALVWRDQVLRNDQVVVAVSGLPALPSGQIYAAWLGSKDGSLPLGALSLSENPATLTFVSPANDNLIGKFSQIYITQAAQAAAEQDNQTVVASGALPEQALVHIRHILFSIGNTPNKIGFALGLRQETDELQRHAQFLKDAFDAGDFKLLKVHAEHINNIIEGSEAHDVNGDGKIQNPGDGFGLLPNGQQDGYIKGMVDHAKLAADAPDATDAIKLHAGHIQIAGENTRVRVQDIHDRAEKIGAATGIADTQQDVLKILALAQQTIQGVDVNLDEQIGPIPGEGGVITAYQHAQLMAGIPLTAGAPAAQAPAPAQAAAAQAPQTFNVAIADNTFTPNKITVPVGATVVWDDKGQKPHTVTADDGSFDSDTLANGASFKQTFTKPGTFAYFCKFHGGKGSEGMAGAIVVTDQSAAAPAASAPTSAAPAPTVQPTAAAAPAPAGDTEVAIGDNTFTPKEISVPVGTTVVWTHKGQRPHTVTADDGSFKSDTLQAGASFKQTFAKPGTFAYFCEFHGGSGGAGMAGVIKVGDGGSAQVAPPAPTVAPAPAAPTAAPAPAAIAVAVSMRDFEFAAKEIKVKVGTVVTWKNVGKAPHSASASDNSFDTTILQPGESKSVTFAKPGTFIYFCQLHGLPDGSGMAGTVVVEQ